jgi:hypothetical protein
MSLTINPGVTHMIRAALALAAMLLVTLSGVAEDKKKPGKNAKTVSGVVKGVDVNGSLITIDVNNKETSYGVAKNAKVSVQGKDGKKLEDVRLGFTATLTLGADDKVTAISADRKKKK